MHEIKCTQLLHHFSVNIIFNTLACYQFTTTELNDSLNTFCQRNTKRGTLHFFPNFQTICFLVQTDLKYQ